MKTPYSESRNRAESHSKRVLDLLRQNIEHGVNNTDLKRISLRYGAIIGSMQRDGYDILVENIGDGLCKYYLHKEPETITPKYKGNAKDILLKKINENYNGEISSEEFVELLHDLQMTLMRKPKVFQ